MGTPGNAVKSPLKLLRARGRPRKANCRRRFQSQRWNRASGVSERQRADASTALTGYEGDDDHQEASHGRDGACDHASVSRHAPLHQGRSTCRGSCCLVAIVHRQRIRLRLICSVSFRFYRPPLPIIIARVGPEKHCATHSPVEHACQARSRFDLWPKMSCNEELILHLISKNRYYT